MSSRSTTTAPKRPASGHGARERLLAGLPVTERHISLAGISTTVLEGGSGPPVLLLHAPGAYAAKWLRVIPDLAGTHRVIAPDLPGHGTSGGGDHQDGPDRTIAWLGELIDHTCTAPPTLVGQILGGAIAARFATQHGDRLSQLILVDALGLAPFQPTPAFGQALTAFMMDPGEVTHDAQWQRCAFDLDRLRERLGDSWDDLRAYNLDRAQAGELRPTQERLFQQFGLPGIPESALAAITVPTTLIWGRHNLATPLAVAQAASARYGWPLRVIEQAANDPPLEQPEAFLETLRDLMRKP